MSIPVRLTASWRWALVAAIVGTIAACSSPPPAPPAPDADDVTVPDDTAPLPPARTMAKSRWTPVRWAELPGWANDDTADAWNALIKNCVRPSATMAPLCPEVRRLSIAGADAQRAWLRRTFQPFRVEPLTPGTSADDGLLTSYYEPLFAASRVAKPGFAVPLYRAPATLGQRKPWFTRKEIDSAPAVQAQLRGREIAYLADPVDAMVLHIQGSGRLRVTEADGSVNLVRVAFGGTNDQPYQSVGRWMMQQSGSRDGSWPAIKSWIARNPQRTQELLWSNPRYVFFKEEAVAGDEGPRGAQGVPLTPGRSIAVDPGSIPYATPVWLSSPGPSAALNRLVVAQDTGSAIVGAVRADYYAGSGFEAGELAGRVKQPLKLWALWPKSAL